MIEGIIAVLVYLYLGTFIVFYLHEIGHFGDKIRVTKAFPFPKMYSYQSRYQYGGILVNALIFTGIWYYNPTNIFLQTVGLVAWLHFIIYVIIGSFNKEYKVPKILWDIWVFDDIPNELWWIFVPLGIGVFFYFKDFYVPIAITLLQMI